MIISLIGPVDLSYRTYGLVNSSDDPYTQRYSKLRITGPREMAKWLRALATLPETMSLFETKQPYFDPQLSVTPVPSDLTPSTGAVCMWCRQTCRQSTHVHRKVFSFRLGVIVVQHWQCGSVPSTFGSIHGTT